MKQNTQTIKRNPNKTHTQSKGNPNKPTKKKKMKSTENPRAFMIQI